MDELEPCPFCGDDDVRLNIETNRAKVRCHGCGASISRAYWGVYSNREEARADIGKSICKAWNRRAKHVPG